jgi:hypothetical protein
LFRRLKQENFEFMASLGLIVRLRLKNEKPNNKNFQDLLL